MSPIISDPHASVSHDLQLRNHLGIMPRDERSPFSQLSSTHMARLTVMNDVVYVGMPACEEHLQSQYLVFESNLDGDLDTYLARMASEIPEEVEQTLRALQIKSAVEAFVERSSSWGTRGADLQQAFVRFCRS